MLKGYMARPQIENGYLKISNELMDALIKIRIPGEARQCLDFILRKTYGYNKKSDAIALSQFVEATGIKKPNVIRSIKKLVDMKIVIKKDTPHTTEYSVQKDYTLWALSKVIRIKSDTPPLSKAITSVIKSDNKSLSKAIHTKDNKDNITKDNIKDNGKYWVYAELYNSICKSLPKVQNPEKLSDVRIKALKNRIKEYPDLKWDFYFKYIENNNFLAGRKLNWSANFDWIINKTNMAKIIEGQYRRDDSDNPENQMSDVERHNKENLKMALKKYYEEQDGKTDLPDIDG